MAPLFQPSLESHFKYSTLKSEHIVVLARIIILCNLEIALVDTFLIRTLYLHQLCYFFSGRKEKDRRLGRARDEVGHVEGQRTAGGIKSHR